jgi:endonuclease-3
MDVTMTQPAAAHKKMKASDRQELLSKVLGVLKKRYKTSPPKHSRPVLETLLFATLLEDVPYADAEKAYDSMMKGFFDLNEIRVSSVAEIEDTLGDLPSAGWKALRIREILQYAFEKFFAFDLEPIRRKTLELAEKTMEKVKYLTPFARDYMLLNCLGAHAVPADGSSLEFLAFLGVVSPDNPKHAAEELRGAVRKADVPLFLHLVHSMASEPAFHGAFKLKTSEKTAGGGDPSTAIERLNSVLAGGGKRPAAKTVRKPEKPAPVERPARKAEPQSARKVAKAKPAKATKRK